MNKIWVLALILALIGTCAMTTEGKTIIVDQEGMGDFTTLLSAVGSADSGDEILILPGTYSGDILIEKMLSISGDPDHVKIVGMGDSVIRVTADGCEISNITIQGSGTNVGVALESSFNLISFCNLIDCERGVAIAGDNNALRDNMISSKCGAEILGHSECELINNTFQGDLGITLTDASYNKIEDCKFWTSDGAKVTGTDENLVMSNRFSCTGKAMLLERSTKDSIIKNTISGGLGVTLSGCEEDLMIENEITGCHIGIEAAEASRCNMTKNNITSCYIGLDLNDSKGNLIAENHVEKCKIGTRLKLSNQNIQSKNDIGHNEIAGIYLEDSDKCELVENHLLWNGYGIHLKSSNENDLSRNEAIYNKYGISMIGSSQNTLYSNVMEDNIYNIQIESEYGFDLPPPLPARTRPTDLDFRHTIDSSNTVNGKPVCYLLDERNKTLQEDFGFVGLISCFDMSISDQKISNCSTGILLVNSTRCIVGNSTLQLSEIGIALLETEKCRLEMCRASDCERGFLVSGSHGDAIDRCRGENCSDSGFDLVRGEDIGLNGSTAIFNKVGISLIDSISCWITWCNASQNIETGIRLIQSSGCNLAGCDALQNRMGITLSASDGVSLSCSNASQNEETGIVVEQLTLGRIVQNEAKWNDDGVRLQSVLKTVLQNNNLSINRNCGLRMSYSSDCEIYENSFVKNEVVGAKLIDCTGNIIYHNSFTENGFEENAVDNGENLWDLGPEIGGNFWSDHDVSGNPGNTPKTIPTKGVDNYPFQHPIWEM